MEKTTKAGFFFALNKIVFLGQTCGFTAKPRCREFRTNEVPLKGKAMSELRTENYSSNKTK